MQSNAEGEPPLILMAAFQCYVAHIVDFPVWRFIRQGWLVLSVDVYDEETAGGVSSAKAFEDKVMLRLGEKKEGTRVVMQFFWLCRLSALRIQPVDSWVWYISSVRDHLCWVMAV